MCIKRKREARVTIGDRFSVTVDTIASKRFYRLRKP